MPTSKKRILITSALPYANGPLHFGHLAGVYIPADIFNRHKKLLGYSTMHICGSDEHGVAITISADKAKMDYQKYVDQWSASHQELFKNFEVEFDFFGRTSAEYHREEVVRWFKNLYEKNLIGKKTEKQLFCNDDQKYLPDRYVEGTCYVCNYANARGDECPNCGEWIVAIQLKEPVCKICSKKNISIKEVEHYYLLLTEFEKEFKTWFSTKQDHWKKLVTGFVSGLLEKGLVDRAISRDLDWGIDVPLPEAKGKKLYVWFDAPIGYVSNTKEYLKSIGSKEDYLKDWWHNDQVDILHFIGKDNIIFHALIWPTMAMGTQFIHPPTQIPANEFLNLEGKQFSKSAGWYVDAEGALQEFGVDSLRFYLCSLVPDTGDKSFSWDGFAASNSDFGNKIGNFIHRAMSFLKKSWPSGLPASAFQGEAPVLQDIENRLKEVRESLDAFEFSKAHSALLALGQSANEYFHAQAPWKQFKEDPQVAEKTLAQSVLYIAAMAAVLMPFVPSLAGKVARYFEGYLTQVDLAEIYAGNTQLLLQKLSKGYQLPIEPIVLIPRIEPDLIKAWKAKLL